MRTSPPQPTCGLLRSSCHFATDPFNRSRPQEDGPSQVNSARIKLFLKDLAKYVMTSGRRPHEEIGFDHATFQWFGLQTPGTIDTVLDFNSEIEESIAAPMFGPYMEPTHECPTCSMKFQSHKQLQTHRYKAHGVRNPLREAINSPQCPVCRASFTSVHGARQHFEKICGLTLNANEIAALQADARQKRETEQSRQSSQASTDQPSGPSVMVLLHLNAARTRREAQAGA